MLLSYLFVGGAVCTVHYAALYEVLFVGPEFSAADMIMLWYAAQTQLTLYSSYNTAMAGCVLPCSQRSPCSHLPDMQNLYT